MVSRRRQSGGLRRARPPVSLRKPRADPSCSRLRADFARPFHVSRRDDQEERGKLGPQSQENLRQDFFLARRACSAEENRSVGIDAERPQHLPGHVRIPALVLRRIVLDAADVMNRALATSERRPALDIFRLLHADQIETAKRRRDQRSESDETVAPIAATAARSPARAESRAPALRRRGSARLPLPPGRSASAE